MIVDLRSRRGFKVQSLLLLVGSAGVVALAVSGIAHSEGALHLVLLTTSLFPVLVLGVAILRMLVALTCHVTLGGGQLIYRQVFKNHALHLSQIERVEHQRRYDNTLVVKVAGAGQSFYVDGRTVDGVDTLVDALRQQLPEGVVVSVESFDPDHAAQSSS